MPQSRGGVIILAYHLVGVSSGSPIDMPLATFERQLAELRDHVRVVSLDRAIDVLGGKEQLDGPAVVLTFDDAYENFYTHAYPVLSHMGLPCTLYVPVDFVDGLGAPPIHGTEGLAPCSWSQLERMTSGRLVSVGSHTCSHPDVRLLTEEEAERELSESRQRLESRLGVTVDSFAYPKGLWSRRLEPLVERHYRSAVIGGGGWHHPARWSPLRLARLPIRSDMPESLLTVIARSLWIEEWISDRVRRHLR